ncbi:MAG TPA: RNA 2',3'-cyclic phosphodiesterase [Pilimelia sp.]|nr:RNA 2',3'-cyclic phosphodiesterase [Pilimelia sp.]
MRLFVAAYPPADVCDHLAAAVDGLDVGGAARRGVNARLAPRANWHVTLAFLGEVPDARAPDAAETLAGAVSDWRAAAAGPPRVRLAGGGKFGRGRFTVLWVGLAGDLAALRGLSDGVRRHLRRARLPHDSRPFRAHLTLARPGDRVDVTGDVAALSAYGGPEWVVEEVALMRSQLGPRPAYERVGGSPLR